MQSSELTLILASFVGGFLFHQFLSRYAAKAPATHRQSDSEDESSSEESSESEDDGVHYKMVLVVRTDLKMKPGKVAAQCSHATLGAVRAAEKAFPKILKKWEWASQPKITLKVENEEQLLDTENAARTAGINTFVVQDAGRTQIAAGSLTILAIGPGRIEEIDAITRHLRLY